MEKFIAAISDEVGLYSITITESDSSNYEKYNKTETTLHRVKWQWLSLLAEQYFSNDETRLKFKYTTRNNMYGLLSLDSNDSIYEDNYEMFKKELKHNIHEEENSFLVMTSFNVDHQYIKIRAINKKQNQKLYSLKMDFEGVVINKKESEKIKAMEYGGRGLGHTTFTNVFKELSDFELIFSAIGGFKRSEYFEKQNVIISGLYSEINKKPLKDSEKLLKQKIQDDFNTHINNEINNENKQINKIWLDISERNPYKIFLSSRKAFIDDDNNENIIKKKLERYGFEVVIAETLVENITNNVIAKMQDCDACLQIYTLSESEIDLIKYHNNQFIPDHGWLLFEYGLAVQKGISIGRMIDTSILPMEKWKEHLRFNTEKLLVNFEGTLCSESKKEKSFIRQLEKLAGNLLEDIRNKQKN